MKLHAPLNHILDGIVGKNMLPVARRHGNTVMLAAVHHIIRYNGRGCRYLQAVGFIGTVGSAHVVAAD
ncbi:hypothetical protein D3C78_1936980 [compost metagenome]